MKALRARLTAAKQAVGAFVRGAVAVLISAPFWFVGTAVVGVCSIGVGAGIEYGVGHGLIVVGCLSLCASELVRRGMTGG